MYQWLALTISLLLVACTSDYRLLTAPLDVIPAAGSLGFEQTSTVNQEQIVKSPQGYVIYGPKDRFGGFIGDCASDENFPYYWECQAESAGDNFH